MFTHLRVEFSLPLQSSLILHPPHCKVARHCFSLMHIQCVEFHIIIVFLFRFYSLFTVRWIPFLNSLTSVRSQEAKVCLFHSKEGVRSPWQPQTFTKPTEKHQLFQHALFLWEEIRVLEENPHRQRRTCKLHMERPQPNRSSTINQSIIFTSLNPFQNHYL